MSWFVGFFSTVGVLLVREPLRWCVWPRRGTTVRCGAGHYKRIHWLAANWRICQLTHGREHLAQDKAHLQSLIQLIDAKPADMACSDNAVRVLDSMGIASGKN